MAKKGKPKSMPGMEAGRSLGRFIQYAIRRCRRYPAGPGRSPDSEDGETRQLSSPVRFVFIVVALPVLVMFFFLMTYALLAEGDLEHLKRAHDPSSRFKYLILEYEQFIVFISASVVSIQLMAIIGALFNWTTVLFAYVVITGLLGTVVGIIGICGIIVSCLFMSHKSQSDHSILITSALVIAFILLFYLLTILGLKLMSYMRRRMASDNSSYCDQEFGAPRRGRPYKSSPVARRGHKRTSYKSIDAITSPFNSRLDDDDDQELSHVYVDSSQGQSLKTLLPSSPPGTCSSTSSSHPNNSFMFQV